MTKGLLTLTGIAILVAMSAQAADGKFAKEHPRRAEVVHREQHAKRNINNAEKSGKLTAGQAKHLDKEESHIRAEERADAKANGGHITKAEQRSLNRQENHVKHQERRDERKDASKGQTGGASGAPATPTPPPAASGTPATPSGQ